MNYKQIKYISLILITIFLSSCKDDDKPSENEEDYSDIYNLPSTLFNYSNVDLPDTFNSYIYSALDNTPNNNRTTDEGATLGRVLFYDKELSFNKTISCSSCHLQEFGFADPQAKSEGFEEGLTDRNSMNIVNSGFYEPGKYFWDHRAASLEDQVLMPFQSDVEMGMTLELIVERIVAQDYYKPLFKAAFNSEEVTSDKVSKALAQFVRSIYSFNTKYDEGIAQTKNIFVDFPNFTEAENLGKDVFNGKLTPDSNGTCMFCHMANENLRPNVAFDPDQVNQVLFVGLRADNIGLDEDVRGDVDGGVGANTGQDSALGQFKTTSIRNIEITGPYMHDGRFETLEEVVEHYSTGVKAHPNLSNHMRNGDGTPRNLNLSEDEKAGLVAFLKTLTDNTMKTDVKYSNPFVNQ